MNERIKDLWLDALTSGEFAQGRAKLRDGANRYCPLGILCELFRRETGNGEWQWQELQEAYAFRSLGDKVPFPFRSHITPPGAVLIWAGLDGLADCSAMMVSDIAEWNDGTDPTDWVDETHKKLIKTPPLSFHTISELIRDFI